MPEAGVGLLLQAFTALLVFLLGAVVTAFGWYVRKHVIAEVEQNSEFRRYASGTRNQRDNGALGELEELVQELDELNRQMDSQHREVSKKVDFVIQYCERIANAVDKDIETPHRRWRDDTNRDD